jgi:uncharacterized protein YkwD
MNNKGSIALEGSVAPGDITQISISLKTPDKDGVYQSFWFLQSSQGYVFGTGENADEPFSIKIAIINSGNDKGNSTFTPNPIMTLNTGCQPNHDASQENALLRSINQERAKQGLILLIPQSQLNRAAQKHSQDMACHNFLSHSGSDGSSPLDRLTTQRYTYAQTNELIYASKAIKSNIQNVMQKWINNENDKTILFNDIYTQIGIGIFSNPNSEFENYVCVVVATP